MTRAWRSSRLRRAFCRFATDTGGTFTVEAVLIFPILLWVYIAMYVFFDAYRQQTVNLKASYTISDMLSRERDAIDQTYVDGLRSVLDFLTNSLDPAELRVTVVIWDEDEELHRLKWSAASGGRIGIDQAEVTERLTPQIPVMADADEAIGVETWAAYAPLSSIALDAFEFRNLVVTSPRFLPKLDWEAG